MNLNRLTKSIALTSAAACTGVVLVGAPSQAATGTEPFATFHGSCTDWSVTYGLGSDAPAPEFFEVDSNHIGDVVVAETMNPGDVNTYRDGFARDGHAKIGVVIADGQVVAAKVFACQPVADSRRKH